MYISRYTRMLDAIKKKDNNTIFAYGLWAVLCRLDVRSYFSLEEHMVYESGGFQSLMRRYFSKMLEEGIDKRQGT